MSNNNKKKIKKKKHNKREHRKNEFKLTVTSLNFNCNDTFLIQVLRFNVRYPSFIIINKYINTSVATVAIKGEFQAYMKRARTSGEGKGTKDVTGAQWQRQGGKRENTMCVKY